MERRDKSMTSGENWKQTLASLLEAHNGQHARRSKTVSHRTREARGEGLYRIFRQLWDLGYRVQPTDLKEKHIRTLMDYWTGEPIQLGQDTGRPLKLAVPLSPAYIQQQLSYLRVLSRWIGKAGLVKPATYYVPDAKLVARTCMATRDHSWSGNGVTTQQVIDAIAAIDARVAVQMEVMVAFGLRRKEAMMFCPHAAMVPEYALPAGRGQEQFVAFLRVVRGTKGGRLRYVPIRSDGQREALRKACALVSRQNEHIGYPNLNLKQALDKFSNVVRRAGLTKTDLGVTAHGLRHEYAQDLYFEITNLPAPIRAEAACDPQLMAYAYHQVAQHLGHNRPQISTAYLGTMRGHGGAGEAQQPGTTAAAA